MSNPNSRHFGSFQDRVKDEVVSLLTDAIVHDFRNLLFVFDANLDLVRRLPDVPAPAQSSLATMMQAANEGRMLTDCLVSLSRRCDTTNTPDPSPESVPLHEVLPPLVSLARKLLPPTLQVRYQSGATHLLAFVNKSDLLHAIFCLILHVRDAACHGTLHVSLKSPHSGGPDATIVFASQPPICQTRSQDQHTHFLETAEALARSIGGTLTQIHAADTTTFSLTMPAHHAR